ncbi:type II toxin-antitoxin system RelB/DinJ family antitoxin [Testudinibacter sp. TR-2022]|uniref:type II toxin-antitoxin system RelB/DinJ family antitoxin n=1 Tax=Testudinibacter sp. TR-2022 TaxID=2585029 RepID=UPI001119A3C1|nr:type II toxin-antitoxin system RelB/DinJ family antitoxin [Testudinibacter sp. TR-2022]TNG95055.1 type II toxin-antitoxin system antitoxin, RelB/DinJ family [Pasteurellaceae bacterium UScroc12]TNG96093.1 type II toxin-antitoxin system antitoxin, RelB/DinJ family [Pasteurellaceae bacterium USgator41]TNG99056.1 type II toxin-antitoxin system antitoxin, RelB/DinJ family [Pasteurellaceae bacterium USgator11]TNG99206.1 type II toxin-antitoxin system antitoxin, RelB/DinJ family [Pasteurellaceae ba
MSANFNMNFDPTVKRQFAEIVAGYGLTVPQAFKLFANQVIKTKVVPLSFDWQANQDVELSDKVLAVLLKNQQEQKEGKSIKFDTIDEMMAALDE